MAQDGVQADGAITCKIGHLKCSFLLHFVLVTSKPFILLACYHSFMPKLRFSLMNEIKASMTINEVNLEMLKRFDENICKGKFNRLLVSLIDSSFCF